MTRSQGAPVTSRSNSKQRPRANVSSAFLLLPLPESGRLQQSHQQRDTEPSALCRSARGGGTPECLARRQTDTLSSASLGRDAKGGVAADPVCHDAWGVVVAPLVCKACGRHGNVQSKSSTVEPGTKAPPAAACPSVCVTFLMFSPCEITRHSPPFKPLKDTCSSCTSARSRRRRGRRRHSLRLPT